MSIHVTLGTAGLPSIYLEDRTCCFEFPRYSQIVNFMSNLKQTKPRLTDFKTSALTLLVSCPDIASLTDSPKIHAFFVQDKNIPIENNVAPFTHNAPRSPAATFRVHLPSILNINYTVRDKPCREMPRKYRQACHCNNTCSFSSYSSTDACLNLSAAASCSRVLTQAGRLHCYTTVVPPDPLSPLGTCCINPP